MLKKKYYHSIAYLLLWTTQSLASVGDTNSYFCVLKKIQRLAADQAAIKPFDTPQVKNTLLLFKRHHIHLTYTLNQTGQLIDSYGQQILLYQGDFDNTDSLEYLFLEINGGTLRTDRVAGVYRLKDDKLMSLNFTKIVSDNLYHGADLGPNFHMWVAKPFAYRKNNTTFLRFMNYPSSRDYNPALLQVFTYVWREHSFKLVEQHEGKHLINSCRAKHL